MGAFFLAGHFFQGGQKFSEATEIFMGGLSIIIRMVETMGVMGTHPWPSSQQRETMNNNNNTEQDARQKVQSQAHDVTMFPIENMLALLEDDRFKAIVIKLGEMPIAGGFRQTATYLVFESGKLVVTRNYAVDGKHRPLGFKVLDVDGSHLGAFVFAPDGVLVSM